MKVEIVVDNMEEFAQMESELFGMESTRYMFCSIHVVSTGITYYYETQYNAVTNSWLFVTI